MTTNRLSVRRTLASWALGVVMLAFSALAPAAEKVTLGKMTHRVFSLNELVQLQSGVGKTEGAIGVLVRHEGTEEETDFASIMRGKAVVGKMQEMGVKWDVIPTIVPGGEPYARGLEFEVTDLNAAWSPSELAPKQDHASYVAMAYEGGSAYEQSAPKIEPLFLVSLDESYIVSGNPYRLTVAPFTFFHATNTLTLQGTSLEFDLASIRQGLADHPWAMAYSTVVHPMLGGDFGVMEQGKGGKTELAQIGETAVKCVQNNGSWGTCYSQMLGLEKGSAGWVDEGFEGFHSKVYRDGGKVRSIWVPSPAEVLIHPQARPAH